MSYKTQKVLQAEPGGKVIDVSLFKNVHVFNLAVTSSAFVEITVPTGKSCRYYVARMASGEPWYFASGPDESSGADIVFTIPESFGIDFEAAAADTLFYSMASTSAPDTIQVMLFW